MVDAFFLAGGGGQPMPPWPASYRCVPGGRVLDELTIRAFLATEYARRVAGVALACGSRAAAEDAVQEALARAWERSERGEQYDSLRAWVMRVAINLTRSAYRRTRAERRAREKLAARGA